MKEHEHDYDAILEKMDERDLTGFRAFYIPAIVKPDEERQDAVMITSGHRDFFTDNCMRHNVLSIYGMNLPAHTQEAVDEAKEKGQELPTGECRTYASTKDWSDELVTQALRLDGVKEVPTQPFWIVRWYIRELKRELKAEKTAKAVN